MLLETNQNGLYCAAGDFYIDPLRPVPRACNATEIQVKFADGL